MALVFLLPVMMWLNLSKNASNWVKNHHIPQDLLGLASTWWLLIVGGLLSAAVLVAILRHHRGALALVPVSYFGRAQWLFLLILWIATIGASMQALPAMSGRGVSLVHMSFWITAGLCSLIVLASEGRPGQEPPDPLTASGDSWRLDWRFWIALLLVPVLLFIVAAMTVASHKEPLPGSHLRFGDSAMALGARSKPVAIVPRC